MKCQCYITFTYVMKYIVVRRLSCSYLKNNANLGTVATWEWFGNPPKGMPWEWVPVWWGGESADSTSVFPWIDFFFDNIVILPTQLKHCIIQNWI